ncbi:OmpA family protein [Paradesertivirga mongoliensis]|uniref:OmpA family protein n=1 Tax=Paradesertivirga mongoliensis TaxID=2100740 RepID=A0ABW4ZP14_9SPHI|nr:OmpA family protein [Pedobacter mongoliensis]
MKIKQLLIMTSTVIFLTSCGTRKLRESEARYATLNTSYQDLQTRYSSLQDSATRYVERIKFLNDQLRNQRASNDQMLNQLKDLSVISGSQAESIKKSLENIGAKDAYIRDLQSAISRKDSLNMALVMNLKGAIGNLDDQDINIKVDKGVVYIDISDKLLFRSGNYEVNAQAEEVLGKVAKVLNNQPDIEFMVEGHTDNVPFKSGPLLDNWDLSVKRATSVIRILQNEYGVPASRITAAGRGEYVPIASNDTAYGKTANRRTRIVILPQLDQFFKLLETPLRS